MLYGTLWILLIAFVTIALPSAYQQLQSAFRTVHPELEDASRILGATRLRSLWQITAPLLRTGVIATWCFIFVGVMRELSAAIILFTSETKVISVLIYDLNESGDLGAIAVIGIGMLIITFAVVIAHQPHPRLRQHAVSFRTLWTRKLPDVVGRRTARANISRRSSRSRCRTAVKQKCEDLLVDVVGLCVTARNEDYVKRARRPATMTARARRSATPARLSAAAPPSSTAPRRMARISTTPSRAARCMPAR